MQKDTQNKKQKEYIKIKDKTVVYYVQIDSVTEQEMEDMMVETLPYSYYEVYN